MRYKHKPIYVNAVKWVGDNLDEIQELLGDEVKCRSSDDHLCIEIYEHTYIIPIGNYIVLDEDGCVSSLRTEVFRDNFELAKEDDDHADS